MAARIGEGTITTPDALQGRVLLHVFFFIELGDEITKLWNKLLIQIHPMSLSSTSSLSCCALTWFVVNCRLTWVMSLRFELINITAV